MRVFNLGSPKTFRRERRISGGTIPKCTTDESADSQPNGSTPSPFQPQGTSRPSSRDGFSVVFGKSVIPGMLPVGVSKTPIRSARHPPERCLIESVRHCH